MANGSLAKRYARALLSLGQEAQAIDQFNDDLQNFAEALQDNDRNLFGALTNPILKSQEKSSVLSIVLEKLNINSTVCNFIKLLLDKGRMVLFFEISTVYQTMADQQAGRVRAEVQTAKDTSAQERNELRKTLAEASNVSPDNLLVNYAVNPDLIGGIIAKVGDTLYDASIRSRLQDLKTTLLY
jgi:F-type H+-transporting ATPase subunit delta